MREVRWTEGDVETENDWQNARFIEGVCLCKTVGAIELDR